MKKIYKLLLMMVPLLSVCACTSGSVEEVALMVADIKTDEGIARKLPQPISEEETLKPDIKQRNIFTVLVDKDDKILTTNISTGEMESCSIDQLKDRVKYFLNSDREESPLLPELEVAQDTAITNYLGACKVSKGIISLQCHNSTSYDKYFQVQNELTAAINELRDELSQNKFSCANHKDLLTEKRKAVERAVPMAISEAKPLN